MCEIGRRYASLAFVTERLAKCTRCRGQMLVVLRAVSRYSNPLHVTTVSGWNQQLDGAMKGSSAGKVNGMETTFQDEGGTRGTDELV